MQNTLKSFVIALVTSTTVLFVLGPFMNRLHSETVLSQKAAPPVVAAAAVSTDRSPLNRSPELTPAKLSAPMIVGMSVRDARDRWRHQGFSIIEDGEREQMGVEAGTIIEQSPEPGDSIRLKEIRVTVASAKEAVAVPSVVGHPLSRAREQLVTAGFEVPDPTEERSSEAPGTVIRQEPNPGAQSLKGSIVRLFVATKPATLKVPRVLGKPRAAAIRTLETAGFVVGRITVREHEERSGGRVLHQDPRPGSQAEAGTTVQMVVVAPD